MNISDLSHDEKVALVALVEALAIADGEVSEGEEREIGRLATELGEAPYRELLDEAERRLPDVEGLKAFLQRIRNQDARDLIYSVAMEESLSEPQPVGAQQRLLDWLAEMWNIRVEIGPDDEGV